MNAAHINPGLSSRAFRFTPIRNVSAARGDVRMATTNSASDVLQVKTVDDQKQLADDAIIWATQHGLVVRTGEDSLAAAVVHAPLAVLPTPFPRSLYNRAWAVMPILNEMVHSVSEDEEFLKSTLTLASEYDEFTANLLRTYNLTKNARDNRRELSVGVHRSDYMFDEPSGRLLQVEINTISSSFGALGTITSDLHRYTTRKSQPDTDTSKIPENPAMTRIANALVAAHEASGVPNSSIAMVVQHNEKNAYDQHWISSSVWEQSGCSTLKCTLKQISEEGRVAEDGTLWIASTPISVVYFRSGYTPNDYPTEREWKGREIVEQSSAAKCPSVAYQLAGSKKVQQELAKQGVLERFLSEDKCEQVRPFFAGLWGLEDLEAPGIRSIVSEAISSPDGFVLKPQREGGGNNLYGEEASKKLTEGKGLAAYILMERIRPPVQTSTIIRNGELQVEGTLSELGIYGCFLACGKDVLLNETSGHLLRTKVSSSDEGGVVAGFGVLDSPYLID